MIVKFLLNGLAVREEIPELEFSALKQAAVSAHPTALSHAIAFEDEDGDMVRIGSNTELFSATQDSSFKPRFHLIRTLMRSCKDVFWAFQRKDETAFRFADVGSTEPVLSQQSEVTAPESVHSVPAASSGTTEEPTSIGVSSSDEAIGEGQAEAASGFDADSIETIAAALQEFITDQRGFVQKLPSSASVEVASAFDAAEKCLAETLRCCATPTDASLNAKEVAGNVLARVANFFQSYQLETSASPSGSSDSDDSAQISMPIALTTPVVPISRSSQLKWAELKLYLDSMKPLLSHPRFASFVHSAVLSVEGLAQVCCEAAAMPMSNPLERTALASFVIDSGVVIPVLELFIAIFGDIGSTTISCNQDLLLRAGFSADEIHSATAAGLALNATLDLDEYAPESEECVSMATLGQLILRAAAEHAEGSVASESGGNAADDSPSHDRRGRMCAGRGRGRGRRHGCGRQHGAKDGKDAEVRCHPRGRRHGRCHGRRHHDGHSPHADNVNADAAESMDGCSHNGPNSRPAGGCRRGGWRRRCGGRAAASDGSAGESSGRGRWRRGLSPDHRGGRFWRQLAAAASDTDKSGGAAWMDALRAHVGGPCRWRRRQAAMAATQPQDAAAAPPAPGSQTPPAATPDADDMLIQEAIRRSLDMRRTMAATPTALEAAVNTTAPISALEDAADSAAAPIGVPAVTVALQRLPAGSSFAGDELSAKFVSHLTVADHNAVSPASTFIKAWRVQNTSRSAWPEGVRLVCVGGHSLGLPDGGHPVPAVPAGETVDISVKLTAPPYPGRNVGYFRLITADGTRFGHRLWCDLVVDNSNVAAVLKALRESGALPGSTSVVTQTSPRAQGGAVASVPGSPIEQDGYVVVPSADKVPAAAADKRVSLRARARGRSGTGSSVASFDGAQGSASMEASMSDCGTPGAEAHLATPALDAATQVAESALGAAAVPTAAAAADADADLPAEMAQYAVQLSSMRELGFADDAAYDALVASKGNVSAAVQALCGE